MTEPKPLYVSGRKIILRMRMVVPVLMKQINTIKL